MQQEVITMPKPKTVIAADLTPRQRVREQRLRQEEEELAQLIKQQQRGSNDGEQGDVSEVSEPSDEEGAEDVVERASDSDNLSEPSEVESSEEVEEPSGEKPKDAKTTDWEKRYKDLQREFTKRNNELKELKGEVENLKEKKVTKVSETDVKTWMEKYPSVAAIVQKIAEDIAKKSDKELAKKFEFLEEMRQEALLAKAEAAISRVHPDYEDIRDSEAFHKWVEKKPEWIKKALYENVEDTDTVAEVITMYKAATNYKAPKVDKAKDAARTPARTTNDVSVRGKESKYLFTESQIAKMSLREYEAREAEIDEARRQGKVLMDLSGAAR